MSNFSKKGEVEGLQKDVGRLHWTITVVVVALLVSLVSVVVGFVGFILDAQRFKAETYQVLVDKVNTLIETNKINSASEDARAQQLKEIKEKYPYIKF